MSNSFQILLHARLLTPKIEAKVKADIRISTSDLYRKKIKLAESPLVAKERLPSRQSGRDFFKGMD